MGDPESVLSLEGDLNSISNDALSKCLKEEFHFDCGPITQSTRSVYLKKLQRLIDEKDSTHNHRTHSDANNGDHFETSIAANSAITRSRTSTARASPLRKKVNDESVVSVKTSSTPKTRRQTIQTPSPAKSASHSPKTTATRKSMTTSARIASNADNNSLSNYSSESSENEENGDESAIRKSPRRKHTPPARLIQDKCLPRVPSARAYPPSNTSAPPITPYTNASKALSFGSLTRPPLRRSMFPPLEPSARLANYSDSEAEPESEQNDKNIRDRLLRHRPLNINAITTQAPISHSQSAGYEESNFSSNYNWISFAILVIVVLFFVSIFSFYFYTRINSFPKTAIDLTDYHFIDENLVAPICQHDVSNPFESDDHCLKFKSDIMPALNIIKEIKTYIDETLFKFYCGNEKKLTQSDPKQYNIVDIERAIRHRCDIIKSGREGVQNEDEDNYVFKRDFVNALTLIELNPNWQLICLKNSISETSEIRISDNYPINLPFGCHTILLAKKMFWQIISTCSVLFIITAFIWYFRNKKRMANEEQDIVYDLVEKSLELLQSPDNPQSMPVLHIRDTLLSAAERKSSKYKRIWDKVVKFIESTESRVKVDVENIDGEDYKAWKWVAGNPNVSISDGHGVNSSPILRTGGIEWQGQAFGENNISQTPKSNNGRVPLKNDFQAPTEFLKIRNMFDKDTKMADPLNWKLKIRNAILEKITLSSINRNHGIVHIEIEDDSSEGLVYLKCSTIKAATDAFKALNGWWCEKKLVSVKFLKAERYYQRFPASANCASTLTFETIA